MDKLTVFAVVVLFGILRGLLQRRQVRAELEERMEKARSRAKPTRLPGKLPTEPVGLTEAADSTDPASPPYDASAADRSAAAE